MGCGVSTLGDSGGILRDDRAARGVSKALDAELQREQLLFRNEIKMLLLGTGESGKSTILKQMKLIHQGSYTDHERLSYKSVILTNIIKSILPSESRPDNPQSTDPQSMKSLLLLESYHNHQQSNQKRTDSSGSISEQDIIQAISQIWSDPLLQSQLKIRNSIFLGSSGTYYMNLMDRILSPGYLPTDQDILYSRVITTGIQETLFVIGDFRYRMVDVGGQRSERKKWIHCFENVTAIIFLVAISEYDQMLCEDETVNRMDEALTLFDSICNNRWFTKSSIVLFLNKVDLFKLKITTSPIERFFPEFNQHFQPLIQLNSHDKLDQEKDGVHGNHKKLLYEAGTKFFSDKFVGLNRTPSKQVYVHLTCATDTKQVRFVLAAVEDMIAQVNLRECGLL